MKRIAFCLCLGLAFGRGYAQTADQAWLKYGAGVGTVPSDVRVLGGSAAEQTARGELERGIGMVARRALGPWTGQFHGQTFVGTLDEVRRAFPDLPVPKS